MSYMPPGSLCILGDPSPKVSVLPFPKSTEAQRGRDLPRIKHSILRTRANKRYRHLMLQVKAPKQKALAGKGPLGATKSPEQRSGVIVGGGKLA